MAYVQTNLTEKQKARINGTSVPSAPPAASSPQTAVAPASSRPAAQSGAVQSAPVQTPRYEPAAVQTESPAAQTQRAAPAVSSNKRQGFSVNGATASAPANVGTAKDTVQRSGVYGAGAKDTVQSGNNIYQNFIKRQTLGIGAGAQTAPSAGAGTSLSVASGQTTQSSPVKATQQTTYIDSNGERRAGYRESHAAVGETLYADQVGAPSGAVETTYWDNRGNQFTGYIINGKTYTDPYGRNEVPVGSVVQTADGRLWKKGATENDMVASSNPEDHYSYDPKKTFEGSIYNSTYGSTGTISGDLNSGKIVVYDKTGNSVGFFTDDGAWHSNVGAGELSDSYEAAGRDYLERNGIKLNGSGVVKLAQGQNYDPVASTAVNRYWDALLEGEGDAWLADNGYVTDDNGVIHYVGGATGQTTKEKPAQKPTDQTAKADGAQMGGAASVTPEPTVVTLPSVKEYNPIYFNPDGTMKKFPTWEEIQEAIHGDDTTGTASPADVTPSAEDTAAAEEAAAAEERARQIEEVTPKDNAQLKELQDQLARVDELLEQAKASNDAAYAAQLEQMKLRIQQQISDLNEQYQGLNKQLYVDYMLHQRDLPQQLSAQGYTGGLRESSMINLRSGYEGQLAENERQRIAGIRDLEAGGQDKELTLGIERLRANQEAEEQAYDRSQAIRAQILTQTNRIEDLARQDKETARKEAQAQINAYISAGGAADQIPASLLSIAGYGSAYVTALASAYAKEQARAQADAILSAGGEVPADIAAAAGYTTDYTDAFRRAEERKRAQQIEDRNAEWAHSDARQEAQWAHSDKREDLQWDREDARYAKQYARGDADAAKQQAQSQVNAILSAGGTVPDELLAAAGYSTAYRDALIGAYGKNEAETQRQIAQSQVDAILKAGGTVPDELLAAAGYSTAYRDALTASAKPTLTAAQVLTALKQGIRSEEVLSAYEYYYGEPYQEAGNQTPTYTYTPPATEPPETEDQDTPGAQSIDSIMAEYQNMMGYADSYAQSGAMTIADARQKIADYIGVDLAKRIKAEEIDKETAYGILDQLGI